MADLRVPVLCVLPVRSSIWSQCSPIGTRRWGPLLFSARGSEEVPSEIKMLWGVRSREHLSKHVLATRRGLHGT